MVIVVGVVCAFLRPARLCAETVALWLFDEPARVAPNAVLSDAGPGRFSVVLGADAEIVPGKFGHALRIIASRPLAIAAPDPKPLTNVTDSRLNLGERDWTLECWLRLEPGANEEGVIFEIGAGPRGGSELVTRISVVPRENVFLVSGLAPLTHTAADAMARRVEFANPEGPPMGVALLRSVALESDVPLLRGEWLHVAIVHAAETRVLLLYVNGKGGAASTSQLMALPRGGGAYLSLGCDGRGGRAFPGAIDELRVSDHVVYAKEFSPPGSFAPKLEPTAPAAALPKR